MRLKIIYDKTQMLGRLYTLTSKLEGIIRGYTGPHSSIISSSEKVGQ